MKILNNRWKKAAVRAALLFGALAGAFLFFRVPDIPVKTLITRYGDSGTRFLPVDGMQVHYRDEGNPADSLPIVLLHGTGASLWTWNGWVAGIGPARRVIRLDLPGFALTGPNAANDYSGQAYTDFLHHFMEALHLKRVHLAGNSLGGFIAWRYGLTHPERVASLTLIDAAGYPLEKKGGALVFTLARIPVLNQVMKHITPRKLVRKSLIDVYADDRKVTDSLVALYYDLTLRTGNREAFIQRAKSQKSPSQWEQIPSLQMPVLILWGKEDQWIPVEHAARFQRDLPNDSLIVYPGVGHLPMEEQPARSVQDFLGWLRRIERR